jgi:predicted  nucleic acid-binding Zn-ribbon protein
MLSRHALVKSRDLTMEMEDLAKRIAQAKNRLELARKEVQDLEARMKISLDEVRKRVDGLSGKRTQIREPDPS